MLKNHFKTAWRNLIRNPFSSFINITGLAVGITCCIFIALYVFSELSADKFNKNLDHIYRVNQIAVSNSRGGNSTSYPLGNALKNEYADIKKIVRLGQDNISVRANSDSYFYETSFYWTDSSFFDVFSYDLVKGDSHSALRDPYSIVINESTARKYFKEEDPIGKVVEVKIYDGDRKFNFTVTGVVKDPPKTAAVQFDFIAPMHTAMMVYPQFEKFWGINWVSTYALVDNINALPSTPEQSTSFYNKYVADFSGQYLEFQPLSKVHLYSGHIGRNLSDGIINVYIFSVIGIFIFLLACVNFVNISTARAELRRKEIGVRKALGAFRNQVFNQFVTEALLTAAIVLLISFAATSTLQPLASRYIEGTSVIFSAFVILAGFAGSIMLIVLFAGLYPAVFLSGFRPLDALKAKAERAGGVATNSRKVLVVFQFTISIVLIAGTFMISKQVHYLKSADLGFSTDQLITIPVDDRALQTRITTVKDLMASAPGVQEAAVTGEGMPAEMNNTWNISWQGLAPDDKRIVDIVSIDYDYFNLLKADFLEGRNISKQFTTDDSAAFIINEAAREMIGEDAVSGKLINVGGRTGTIVGVVKDIHHFSLHQKVKPIAYFPVPAGNRACSDNVILKISSAQLPATLESLKRSWETLTQDRPFEYHFVDDNFARAYESEEKFLVLFEVFAGLAIVIACLGLMGLSSFVVTRRSKEIGIRKVLGASVSQIILMLTRGFSIPILIAFVLAAPVVYTIMSRWLDKFAYRVSVDVILILLSGIVAWMIAFAFIGFQSWKAARVNPVVTLKDE